jgi:hypothetical protein
MMRCPEINPQGQQCALGAGHAGVHQVAAEWGPPLAPSSVQPSAGALLPPPPPLKQPSGAAWLIRLIVIVIVALVVGGILNEVKPAGTTAPAGGNPPAGAGGARSPVTVSGSGIEKSKPFTLSGTYSVTWKATPDSDVGCYHGADLERADGSPTFESLVNEILDSKAPKSGTTQVYNLDSASYYVDANSGCSWTFTFTPS